MSFMNACFTLSRQYRKYLFIFWLQINQCKPSIMKKVDVKNQTLHCNSPAMFLQYLKQHHLCTTISVEIKLLFKHTINYNERRALINY